MHTLDQYRGTIVACRYNLPASLTRLESLETLKGVFYNAIAQVVLAQPHLQTGIIGENSKNPEFVRLDRLDFRNHVKWITLESSSNLEQQYLKLMQSQLDARYSHLSSQPGWRVIILHDIAAQNLEVLYVWNHPHHDGMSGKIFHHQLLQILNENSSQNKESVLETQQGSDNWVLNLPDSSQLLPPPPEVLIWWPMTPVFLVKALWKELKPLSIFGPSNTHATWAPVQVTPFATRFHTFTVDNDVLTKVVSACHQHQTTLTGLLHGLVLVSLTSALEGMKGFASRTPYDLRHFLPSNAPKYPHLKPKESMCNYVSVLDHEFDAELVASIRDKMPSGALEASLPADVVDIVWSVSSRVRKEIQARLDSANKNDMIGIMRFVSDWRPQQESEAHKPRYLSWLVTNLGVLDGAIEVAREQEQSWSIRRAELVLSAEVPSAALSVSIMTVKDSQMCVTCSWQDCVVDASLGERLLSDLERWLKQIVS
ncbi:alcohol acetyltransferase-domain-containing protein [Truncatella angustata]|uniref:Alcohol acetyltransferase-domain-containing protein n=1 Tax=Truncatella angustata TaxID=152316 RepID=A0A9P8RFX2_9PEZI|nr:alcohol acetyltransferase-domain-containing protein [Truncatella angustata]KAH6645104.1 alcohol acetyltransferase-domain-containing protein [Truncatella angustata]